MQHESSTLISCSEFLEILLKRNPEYWIIKNYFPEILVDIFTFGTLCYQ